MVDDVRDEAVPGGIVHHVANERARLAPVVSLGWNAACSISVWKSVGGESTDIQEGVVPTNDSVSGYGERDRERASA